MDSSSLRYSYDRFVWSFSSDSGTEILLSTMATIVKTIVEDSDEGTSQPEPK
ncbi:hypothetical protein Hanom_Chr15g01359771 [Helianthus anomalus]